MEFGYFVQGLMASFAPYTFFMMVVSSIAGIIIGALPGMTASMGIILILPFLYYMPKDVALLMMSGVFCGANFGGAISAILINTPGTPSASATVIDGYQMTRQGKAGKALGMSMVASFVGGIFSSICLLLIAPELAKFALQFQAADYFSLSIFGLSIMASASSRSILKGLISGWVGLLLSTVGIDTIVGVERFTFGIAELGSGFDLLPVLIGVFAVGQFFEESEARKGEYDIIQQELTGLWPTWAEMRSVWVALVVGCIVGIIIGVMPGAGGAIACFMAYNEARRWSKRKDLFGKGSLEGVAAPECANNATTGGDMVPMLTLGVPGDVVTAVMLGALMLIGIKPGPLLFVEQPVLVYTLLAGFITMQIMMLFLGMLSIYGSVRILSIPNTILMPVVMVLCVVGVFTIGNQLYQVGVAVAFGIFGYFMKKLDYPGAPLVLGVILGPMAEDNLNRALLVSANDWSILVRRPISLVFLILAIISIVIPLYTAYRGRERVAPEAEAH
jgi:putative tricarboxylic transport membrane protein